MHHKSEVIQRFNAWQNYFGNKPAYDGGILDMQRFNLSRLSCFSRSSRVCAKDFEARKNAANEIPEGPERIQAMIDIAEEAYEQVYFLPLFEVAYVYGLSPDLEWQPYYAPRLRGNTLRFSQ